MLLPREYTQAILLRILLAEFFFEISFFLMYSRQWQALYVLWIPTLSMSLGRPRSHRKSHIYRGFWLGILSISLENLISDQ